MPIGNDSNSSYNKDSIKGDSMLLLDLYEFSLDAFVEEGVITPTHMDHLLRDMRDRMEDSEQEAD